MSAEPQVSIDPFLTEEYARDPVATVERMRAEDPVHWIPGIDGWMVTRYDDVRQLFADPNVTPDPHAFDRYVPPPEGTTMRWVSENTPFAAPPDQHARMRRLVSSALTPRAVRRQEAQVREVVEHHAARLRGRSGVVDIVAEFTGPIPNAVIARITGVPPKGDDEARFRHLAGEMVRGISPFLTDEERKSCEKATVEICDYTRELASDRRENPAEDLVSDLLAAHDADDPVTNDEIVLMVAGLVAAGSETTTIGGTRAIRTLLQNPDQMQLLRDDLSLIPNAVNESLRFDFGSAGLPRYALRDFELRGKQIRKGQVLMLNFTGAHRDPEVFPDPDRFDVRRDTKDVTIFGHGPHYCLGANLARTEMGCMIEAALDFLPEDARLLEDQIEWTRTSIFGRIQSLPVDFGA